MEIRYIYVKTTSNFMKQFLVREGDQDTIYQWDSEFDPEFMIFEYSGGNISDSEWTDCTPIDQERMQDFVQLIFEKEIE